MGLAKPSDDRWFPRYHTVNSDFALVLTAADDRLSARLVDVSRDGIGVLVEREMAAGAVYGFELDGKHVKLCVVYCQRDLIHAGRWRAGLRRQGSSENLVSLFVAQKLVDP